MMPRIWLNNPKAWDGGWFPGLDCNSGGPQSRARTERLHTTVLGTSDGYIRMPRVRRLGLTFGDADPVEVAWELLALEGLNDPEDLRGLYPLPKQPLICRVDSTLAVVDVGQYPRRGVLEDALWLGLCTNWAFDPSRPVFWTATSLTRRLEVFAGDGFYT